VLESAALARPRDCHDADALGEVRHSELLESAAVRDREARDEERGAADVEAEEHIELERGADEPGRGDGDGRPSISQMAKMNLDQPSRRRNGKSRQRPRRRTRGSVTVRAVSFPEPVVKPPAARDFDSDASLLGARNCKLRSVAGTPMSTRSRSFRSGCRADAGEGGDSLWTVPSVSC
jgi:hypothetical protein